VSFEVTRFLSERGCPDDVVEGGLEGLIAAWKRVADHVADGYSLGLDDYLNDLDGRQLLEEALAHATDEERASAMPRIRRTDERMKSLVVPTLECLWGDKVAEQEGWSPESHWWYFSLPRAPGELLREDLGEE